MAGKVGGIVVAFLLVVSCSRARDVAAPPSLTVADEVVRLGISGATNAGAGVAASGDRVVVTWAATVGDKTNVYAATSLDEGRTFAGPVRVNDVGGDARMSGEQAPRIALGRDLAIGWVSRLGGQSSIRVARSTDDGRSFAPARSLHPPALAGLRGWPSFAMGDGDAVHAAWLDTRQAAAENAAHAAHGATAHQAAQGHHGSTRQDLFHALAVSRRHVDRDDRRDRRMLLLQDRGDHGAGRRRLRRVAARVSHEPSRHRAWHIRATAAGRSRNRSASVKITGRSMRVRRTARQSR